MLRSWVTRPAACQVRTAGQLASLEDHYVSAAQLRQMVGDAAADNSASDDDDLGTVGKIRAHGSPPAGNYCNAGDVLIAGASGATSQLVNSTRGETVLHLSCPARRPRWRKRAMAKRYWLFKSRALGLLLLGPDRRARPHGRVGRGAQLPGPQLPSRRGEGGRRRALLSLERVAAVGRRHRRGRAGGLPGLHGLGPELGTYGPEVHAG